MKIYIINGSGGCGKDTFVDKVQTFIGNINVVHNISTVDPIRNCMHGLGFDNKDSDYRKFISGVKQLWIECSDGPFEYVVSTIESISSKDNGEIAFVHSREPIEIDRFKMLFGQLGHTCSTVLVEADTRVPVINTNDSDANVRKYTYDVTIDNNGSPDDLDMAVLRFLHKEDLT